MGVVDVRLHALLTSEVNIKLHSPAALSSEKETRYPLDRRLGAP